MSVGYAEQLFLSETDREVRAHELDSQLERIHQYIRPTPVHVIDRLENGAVLLGKYETDNMTGSFKERGAFMTLLAMPDVLPSIHSAGNAAAGYARAGSELHRHVTVWMPTHTPSSKIANVRRHGGHCVTVHIAGNSLEHTAELMRSHADINGLTPLSPYDCRPTIDGQRTTAWELLRQYPDVDTIVVPVGGGSLLAGTLEAVAASKKNIKVLAVQLEGNDSLENSLRAAKRVPATSINTVCEGSAVQQIGKLPFEIVMKYRHMLETVTVPVAEIGECIVREDRARQTLVPVLGSNAWDGFPETTGFLAEAGARRYARRGSCNPDEVMVAIVSGANTDPAREDRAVQAYHSLQTRKTKLATSVVQGLHTCYEVK